MEHTFLSFLGILDLLYYPIIGDREADIAETYGDTFSWALEDDGFDRMVRMRAARRDEMRRSKDDSSFVSWLLSDSDHLFWLSGKAASGKPTLMKYLYNDKRTKKKLRTWAGGSDPILAAFFFFERGDTLQKSREGLLRSLLYQILSQREDLIPLAFDSSRQDRNETISLPQLTWVTLKKAFTQLLDRIPESANICLFVDGLDEYRMIDRKEVNSIDEMHLLSFGTNDDFKAYPEGSWIRDGHQEIASIFQNINTPNVKICVASRELAPFEAAFVTAPRLRIHDFTKTDIHNYVYCRLMGDGRAQFYDGDEMKEIADTVVKQAEGVFLWVRLVVEELRKGQDDGDRIEDLLTRLMRLPKTLGGKNGLYMKMIDMSPSRDKAIQLFQLALHHMSPPDLDIIFYAADELYETDHPKKNILSGQEIPVRPRKIPQERSLRAVNQEVKFFTTEQEQRNLNQLERRLKSRCMGLLEVPRSSRKVQFMHQTAKEFIHQHVRAQTEEKLEAGELGIRFLSAYTLKLTRHNLSMGVHSASGETQGWHTFESCFKNLMIFALSIDQSVRFNCPQRDSYFQLMEKVMNICESLGQSQDQKNNPPLFQNIPRNGGSRNGLFRKEILPMGFYITLSQSGTGILLPDDTR